VCFSDRASGYVRYEAIMRWISVGSEVRVGGRRFGLASEVGIELS
jgi:hypothetical protein